MLVPLWLIHTAEWIVGGAAVLVVLYYAALGVVLSIEWGGRGRWGWW